jgi:uncharacterized protein (TIGR02996 family)
VKATFSSCYVKAIKYSTSAHPTEVAFHKAIHENPEEHTTALAYADWLEENGREAEAEMWRAEVEHSATLPERHPELATKSKAISVHGVYPPGNGKKRVSISFLTKSSSGQDLVSINVPSLHDNTKQFYMNRWSDRNKTIEAVKKLRETGFSLAGVHTILYLTFRVTNTVFISI